MKFNLISFPCAALGLLLTQNVQAAGVNFHFLVNSSGTQIYPCDAGLYDANAENGESWLSANYAAYDGNSVIAPSAWNSLYLRANLPANLAASSTHPFKTIALSSGITAIPYTVGPAKFGNVLRDETSTSSSINPNELTFNLGSQKYGAKYFIDFCFRDSQVAWIPTMTAREYEIVDGVTSTNISSTGSSTYWENAILKVQGKIVCDSAPATITESVSASLDGLSGSSTSVSSSLRPALALAVNAVQQPVLSTTVPFVLNVNTDTNNHCVIRYIFSENATNFRHNDLKTAEFAIALSVTRKY